MMRITPKRLFLIVLVLFGSWLGMPACGWARPPYKKALADFLGPLLAPRLNSCQTCHLPDDALPNPKSDEERPHNVFGARLKAIGLKLRQAGAKHDIAARLRAIADEDSDGDGVPNLLELLTGHLPGDSADKPGEAELALGKQKLAGFLKNNTGYPWAPFDKVQRPPLPAVQNAAWVSNPIDAFIAAEHEAHGLKPRPEAPSHILLRRLFLDLTGLPPAPEDLHAFLKDASSQAYEKVVDRLLASPRYGERWGRHWMDVWRYSDWAGWGAQVRDSQPHIWHWRDWILEALNADKGYDRMLLEMLAGDAWPRKMPMLRATGYLVRNFKLLSREKWLQDTVDHTFLAFQGVTLGCARCHDHMYDPIRQKEYYQVRAIFEPHHVRTDRLPGEADLKKNGLPRVFDANPEALTYLFLRGDDRTPDKSKPLPAGVPEALGGQRFRIAPVTLPRSAYIPDSKPFVIQETLAAGNRVIAVARAARDKASTLAVQTLGQCVEINPLTRMVCLAAGQKRLEELALAEAEVNLAVARQMALTQGLKAEELETAGKKDQEEWKTTAQEATRRARQAVLLDARRVVLLALQAERQAPLGQRPQAMKKVADARKVLSKAEADVQLPSSTAYPRRQLPSYPASSTGRRLALARWLASRDNPLTARVAMNHIWLRHFGQAIVPSVFDFGRNGRPPSHPALLDWLADEFMQRGWSMKAMHRLIVTSSTYRMASTLDPACVALDRDNKYLWHISSRRLEAEAVRDSVFHVAGRLDLTMGGPDLDHTQGLTIPRRSLYFRHAAEKQMEFLKLFDCAAVAECYQRKDSILPQQALALSNSELALRMARLLARQLHHRDREDSAFTVAAFERVLSRRPTAEEQAECVAFLQEQTRRHEVSKAPLDPEGIAPAGDPALRARENLVHVLLNHHEFVTVR